MFRRSLAQPFERVMGYSLEELMGILPRALPSAELKLATDPGAGRCTAVFEDGQLVIECQVLAPRQIAMLRLPQLKVRFTYSGLSDARRREIQAYFDLATQRGGG